MADDFRRNRSQLVPLNLHNPLTTNVPHYIETKWGTLVVNELILKFDDNP